MSIEIITAENAERLDNIGPALAETYQEAFAGPPWFEVSKCVTPDCAVAFLPVEPDCMCPSCGFDLDEAYGKDELVTGWRQLLEADDAVMEVAYDGEYPQRATIARPTDPEELWMRKYATVPAMKSVLTQILPPEFVWIEDTFANRRRVPTGNLRDRGKTIDRISQFYGGDLLIATRTLSEAIVRATLRDKLGETIVRIGTERAGSQAVNRAFNNPGYELSTVPDRRTLLTVQSRARS
jgi:hypothetical protein